MDDLPFELIVLILQYLNKNEQLKFSRVNKIFHEAVFSPSLWTENEESLEVPPDQIKSFRKFLKQLPWLRYLNVQFKQMTIEKQLLTDINLPSVLKPLKNLEHLSLELYFCKSSETYFPNTLKQISLYDRSGSGYRPNASFFINDDLLKILADSCPLLEYIEIKSSGSKRFSRQGLQYLLDKVKDTLQTLILSDCYIGDSIFGFIDCPPNVQILTLSNCFFIRNKDFNEKLCLPNLQILYLNDCFADLDVVLKLVKCCPSLKVLAWHEPLGYSNKALSELEKLSKQKSVKIYLNFTADPNFSGAAGAALNFPPFPNENFLCLESFNNVFSNKHHFITNFFKGGMVPH